jgi:hypothetical protein
MTFHDHSTKWQRNIMKQFYETEVIRNTWLRVTNLNILKKAYAVDATYKITRAWDKLITISKPQKMIFTSIE